MFNWTHIAIPLAFIVGAFSVAANLIWLERRLLALFQDRYGPNRVGPFGLILTIADTLKMFFKEDWVPRFADKPIYVIAPAIVVITSLVGFAVVPVAPGWVVFDSSIGLLFWLAASSLGAYSITLGGWASNNKYALIGAMRGAAQGLSYEVFMGLSLLGVVAMTGSFRLTDIVEAQKDLWFVVPQFVGFVIFFIAGLAETHRLPFDLPESESEIIAGFHSEYSGMKFGLFFVGEYVGITLVSTMISILFFGGWLGPVLPPFVWLFIKTLFFICTFILIRATLARPRYDQLMRFGWQCLLPIALINLLVTGGVILWLQPVGQ